MMPAEAEIKTVQHLVMSQENKRTPDTQTRGVDK
jgi:hypothetical protein